MNTQDARLGMAWWNALMPAERRDWMARAGDTGIAADAWAEFKRSADGNVMVPIGQNVMVPIGQNVMGPIGQNVMVPIGQNVMVPIGQNVMVPIRREGRA